MTEYRIKCWNKRDLFAGPAMAAAAGTTLEPFEFKPQSSISPASDILVKRDLSKNSEASWAILAEDATLDGTCFPAGSHIVPGERYGAVSNNLNGLIIGIIETANGLKSESLVFANGNAPTGQYYDGADAGLPNPANERASFVRGTLIETPHGAMPVEHLEDGDEVMTPNGGIQLITGLNSQRFSGLDLALMPSLVPVRIMAGALTGGRPGHDLLVSQGHRLLVDDWRAAYLFGEDEILVPAISLLNNKSVVLEDHRAGVEYFEISLEDGGLICANGLWAETSADQSNQCDVNTGATGASSEIVTLPRATTVALVA